jgi:hypothetical protein
MSREVEVEVNLKIPRLTLRSPNEEDKVIDNGSVRFLKLVTVPALPKPGASLELTAASAAPFACDVIRADWNEGKEMFVVYCKYAKRSITPGEYHAIVNDPDWKMKPLLS